MTYAEHKTPARAGLLVLALISLSVLFAGRAGAAEALTLNMSSFDFGAKNVGGEMSEPAEFVVTNDGATTVELGYADTTPVSPLTFVINPAFDYCSYAVLQPGESCTVMVVFEPTVAGDFTGQLLIPSDAPGSPLTADLTGTAYPQLMPDVAFTPDRIDFGGQGIGTTSAIRKVEIKDTGQGDMAIGEAMISGRHATEYRIVEDRCKGRVVASGSTCVIDVDFTPAAAGIREATLIVPTDVPEADSSVPLTGTGLGIAPDPDPDPDPDPTPPGTAGIRIGKGPLRLTGRMLRVPVICEVERIDRCRGGLTITTGTKSRKFRLGTAKFDVAPGRSRISVKLKPRAVRAIRRRGRLGIELATRTRQGDGTIGSASTKRIVKSRR